MDVNLLRGIVTVASLLFFLGICAWAYSRRNRSALDAIGRSVIEDDDTLFKHSSETRK